MGKRFFFFPTKRPYRPWAPVTGIRIIIPPAIKRPGREADYSLSLTTEIKDEWRRTSIPLFVFHVVYSNDFNFHRLKLSVFENKKQEIWRPKKKKLHDHHNNVSSRLRWNAVGRTEKENAPRRTDSLYPVNSRPVYLLPLVQCGCLLCVPWIRTQLHQVHWVAHGIRVLYIEHTPITQQTPTDPTLFDYKFVSVYHIWGSGTVLQDEKIAGSIPDGSIGIFHWLNPSGRPMTLGSTQSLT